MLQIVVALFLLQLPWHNDGLDIHLPSVVVFTVLQMQDLSNMQQLTYISYYHAEKLMAVSHSYR